MAEPFVHLRRSLGISELNPGISQRPHGEVTNTRAVLHLPRVFVSTNKIDLWKICTTAHVVSTD